MKRTVFIITILFLSVISACHSCPPVAARSYVPIPEKPKRSASFAIHDGLDDNEAKALLQWIINDGKTEDEVEGTRGQDIRSKLKDVLAELKTPVTFKDLSKDGRINRFFGGLPEGRPLQALDTRFDYRILSNEIVVLVDIIAEHPANQYAFAFYRLPQDRAVLPARAPNDDSGVIDTTVFSQLIVVNRNSVETIK